MRQLLLISSPCRSNPAVHGQRKDVHRQWRCSNQSLGLAYDNFTLLFRYNNKELFATNSFSYALAQVKVISFTIFVFTNLGGSHFGALAPNRISANDRRTFPYSGLGC